METLKKIGINRLIEALVMIIIGVVLIVWTGNSIRLFARILAALLILIGVLVFAAIFTQEERNVISSAGFVAGIIVAAVGVWIFVNPDTFTDFIPKLFGIFIIISGIVNLGQTITLIRNKYDYWSVSLLLAVITIGMGVVLLVEPTFVKEFLVTLIGIFLVYDGVSNIWTITRVAKYVKEKVQEETAVDTQAVIIEENSGDK